MQTYPRSYAVQFLRKHIWNSKVSHTTPKMGRASSRETIFLKPAGQKVKRQRDTRKASCPSCIFVISWIILSCSFCQPSFGCDDVRANLFDFECLDYDAKDSVFNMTCSFTWTNNTQCIHLFKNERFEGNGHGIYLKGVANWEGLFRIADSNNGGPSSLANAPVIRDVHMVDGETSDKGGFIVQANQKNFIVDHCSSSGVIQGEPSESVSHRGGGGICGHGCSGDILITHCWSSGEIRGTYAGGLVGREFGVDGDESNTMTISNCYTTGDIVGDWSGGICGIRAGENNNNGLITIKQCYSLGEIRGEYSGGISGGNAARGKCHVFITNSYSRGNMTGPSSGGICGYYTGGLGGTVVLTKVYASGQIIHPDAGGLIGHISPNAKEINITMSVFNGETGNMIGHDGAEELTFKEKNSANLSDIMGTIYCYNDGKEQKECWDTESIWQQIDDGFPMLRDMPTSLPSEAAVPSSNPSPTPKKTVTSTASPSATPTPRGKRPAMQLPVQYPVRSVLVNDKQ